MSRSRERILANLDEMYREAFERAKATGDAAQMATLDFAYRREQLYFEILLDVRDAIEQSRPIHDGLHSTPETQKPESKFLRTSALASFSARILLVSARQSSDATTDNASTDEDDRERQHDVDLDEVLGQHLEADEREDDGETVLEQVKAIDHRGEQEVERPQPEHREDVRREDDERDRSSRRKSPGSNRSRRSGR